MSSAFSTRAAIALVILLVAASKVVAQDIEARYYLPKSVLVLNGTIETRNVIEATTTEPREQAGVTTMAIVTVSDPSAGYVLRAEEAMLSKTGLTVEFAGGSVSALNRSAEGQLGTVIKSIFGAVVGIAKLASGIPRVAGGDDVDRYYLERQPDDARRRGALQEALADLQSEMLIAQQQVTKADAEARELLMKRLKDLEANNALLRRDLAEAEVLFAAWKSRTEDRKERKVTLMFDVDNLPPDAGVRELTDIDPSDEAIEKAAGEFWPIANQLRVIVTQTVEPTAPVNVPAAGTTHGDLFYRPTRPVLLSLYRLTDKDRPVLVQQTLEHVVGAKSGFARLSFNNTKWGKKTLGATFAGGTLTKVTTENTPATGAIADTARALPAEYLAAVKQANDITSEERKLALQETEAQIERAKKQKEIVEAQITAREISDLSAARSEITRLETEVTLLEARRQSGLATGLANDRAVIQLEQELLKLQNELTKAAIERLELQRTLAAVAGGGGQ